MKLMNLDGQGCIVELASAPLSPASGYELTITATGRAVRFIVLIMFVALFVAVTRNEPRSTRPSPTPGGGLPVSGISSPRPGMRSLAF